MTESRQKLSEPSLKTVEETIADAYDAVQAGEDLEIGLNGWPTTNAIADQTDHHLSSVQNAIRVLESRGAVVGEISMITERSGNPCRKTVAPADVVETDQEVL